MRKKADKLGETSRSYSEQDPLKRELSRDRVRQ